MLKSGHQVDRYSPTSNPRRLNVDIYPAIGKVDFYVESTSILRRKVSVRTWFIFQRRFNVRVRLGKSIQRLRESRGVTISRPDCKDLPDFARLPTAFNRGFEPTTGVHKSIDKLGEKKPPVVQRSFNFPYLTGWGV